MTPPAVFMDPHERPPPMYTNNPAVSSLLETAEEVAAAGAITSNKYDNGQNNNNKSKILIGNIPNPTVSAGSSVGIANFAVMSSSGSISLQSNSESSFSSACTTERKRRVCVCKWGDACQVMTTGFACNKNDPRGAFVILPSYEVQMITSYCKYLKEDNAAVPLDTSSEDEDPDPDDLEEEEFVVAVHHFHPTVIEKFFDSSREARLEDDLLPMPARTMTSEQRATLVGISSDSDRVVNHQTGAPTGEFWVVPSYPFDQAHADLKKSMGGMRQHDVERCVRRMKREARRQKWEHIVDKWEAVSKRSGFHTSAALLGVHSPTPTPGPARHSLPPIITTSSALASTTNVCNAKSSQVVGQQAASDVVSSDLLFFGASASSPATKDYGSEWDEPEEFKHRSVATAPGPNVGKGSLPDWDAGDQVKRGSLMTAQEVLECEFEEEDDESDLNTTEDAEVVIVSEADEKPEVTGAPQASSTNDPKAEGTSGCKEDDGSLSSISAEGASHEVLRHQSVATSDSSPTEASASTSSTSSSSSSQGLLLSEPKEMENAVQSAMKPSSVLDTHNQSHVEKVSSSVKSRAVRVLAMGMYGAFLLNLFAKAVYCIGALKAHKEAFA
ncbi:expressed unknown protein [Seminavis robusta]|uniref:Uncharacterized protein n=1 Tax=Seminavis robusta TaxID=568900 RepID=A0A9N8EKA8_9STRA|nr:expressed unknown protein [Seminavis robusta]|eukprot:Sro1401_g269450.1 n/a (613) ;mRNA; r:12593-14431